VLLYEAEIVTLMEMTTKEVLTVNVALVAPAGTVTAPGVADRVCVVMRAGDWDGS